jgi:hypothetical protein
VFYQHFIKILVERLKRKYDSPSNYYCYSPHKQNGKKDAVAGGEEKKEGESAEKEEKDTTTSTTTTTTTTTTTEDSGATQGKDGKTKEGEKEKDKDKDKGTSKGGDGEGKKEGIKSGGRADLSAGFVQNNVCELLSYCIRHHGYRIKYFLLGGNAVQKVLKLLDHRDAFLVLGILP